MNTIEIISLLSSLTSLVLAVLAIWMALYHKKETDITNEKVRDLLLEVKTDAKVITTYALPELQKYSDAMVDHVFYGKNRDVKEDSIKAAFSEKKTIATTPNHEESDLLSEFQTLVEKIHEGDGFTNKERDSVIRLVRKIKDQGLESDPEFHIYLEQLIDSFAAADQNKYVDMLDEMFSEITISEEGINQTMLTSLGLRLLEVAEPDSVLVARFEKHMSKSAENDTIEYGLPALLVYSDNKGDQKKVESIFDQIKSLDQLKIVAIQESIERRSDAVNIARRPSEKIKKVAEKYKMFSEKYSEKLASLANNCLHSDKI